MRDLVESRSVVAVLVGLYVLATLGAIPVPAVVLTQMGSGGDSCVSVCACTSCSPSSCCCAMLEPVPEDDKGGVAMFGYSCQPTVTWFLAILPPAVEGAALSGVAAQPFGERAPPALVRVVDSEIGVPTPPPKRSA